MWVTRLVVLALLLLPFTPFAASGQRELLQPGVNLRIPGRGDGLISHRNGDTLLVVFKNSLAVPLAISSLGTVQLRGEKDRRAGALRGGLIGLGAGALAGIAVWVSGDSTDCLRVSPETWEEYQCSRTAGPGDAALAALGGAMVGAGIGALVGRRTWYSINVASTTAALHMVPGRGLTLSLRRRRRGRGRSV